MKLSKQEKEIAESVERGDWRSVRGVKKQMKRYQDYAKATVRKDKRVNIRNVGERSDWPPEKGNGRRVTIPDPYVQCPAQVRQQPPGG